MAAANFDHPLVRHLANIAQLSDDGKQALANLPMQVASLKADEEIVREGDRPTRSFVILEGFVINFKVTGEGNRQILAYHLPGDIPDLQSLHLTHLDSSWASVTPCKVGFIPHEALHKICDQHSDVARAFWRWT